MTLPQPMSPPSHAELRDELQRLVLADLLGPVGGPEEIVDERIVRDRYLIGMLAPKGVSNLPEEDEELTSVEGDAEDGPVEAPVSKAATMLPSSIGLTFAVAGDAQALKLTACWGQYRRTTIEEERYRTKDGSYYRVWQRHPVQGVSDAIPLKPGLLCGRTGWAPSPDQPDVYIQGRARRRGDQWVVTVFLINGQKEPKQRKDEAWVFQPELTVESADGSAIFQKRPLPVELDDPERQSMAMLYRHEVEFAVGHGVAAHADLDPECPDRAVRVCTQVAPVYDVPQTTPPTEAEIPALQGLTLDMKTLAGVPDGAFAAHLSPLVTAYGEWIAEQARLSEAADLAAYAGAAYGAVETCRQALARIGAGIALLDQDPVAAEAFRFANRAMYLQRVRTLYAAAARRGEKPKLEDLDTPANHTWRAFQLAFILLNLPGLTSLRHPDRAQPIQEAGQAPPGAADLLWFPTGGGKTEAYLGLTAYTLAVRRLQGEVAGRSGNDGVAVLMRYTLRLLTLQQFQRAAALICACEVIRREAPAHWGLVPFRIGLWVGRRTTPNWTKDAAEAVKQLRGGGGTADGNPHQLTNCPWCGQPIDPGRDFHVEPVEQGRGRTFIYCSDAAGECPFSRRQSPDEGIPALVVDEEIYRRLPALLIATVDKFAQMPWNGATAMLFGQVNGQCERHGYRSPEIEDSNSHPKKGVLPAARTLETLPLRPPDLIIQDELHLISGPLGTLVGLYETAVDRLGSWDVDGMRVQPKVIASTATIRRADRQVNNVFRRRVAVFPPHDLDVRDNFFSRQRPP
ncbi:MAG: helicase, partial [Anaerolineae bacterium]|nr:helicase [Anaerolineae bacterium]